jgi:putative endonuclease
MKSAAPSKIKSYKAGHWAEMIAAIYFMMRGYRIIARRFKTPVGEIDLILKSRRTLVFVEVKARGCIRDSLEAVHTKNQERVGNAALYFLSTKPDFEKLNMRFDVLGLVLWRNWWPVSIHHLDNAWQSE